MLNKINKWIINLIRNYLDIPEIEEAQKELREDLKRNKVELAKIKDDLRQYKYDIINDFNKLNRKIDLYSSSVDDFSKLLNVAVDLGVKEYHQNWAVVTAKGQNQDYVKFVDLSNLDYRDVMMWTKRLEEVGVQRGNMVFDTPYGMSRMFRMRD